MDTVGQVFDGVYGGAAGPARKRRSKRGNQHPGVKIYKRKRTTGYVWLARWIDPDHGREIEASLTKRRLYTPEERTQWAINKAREIAERQIALIGGSPRLNFTPIEEAVQSYFRTVDVDLRPSTIRNYKETIDQFVDWAATNGVSTLADVSVHQLSRFRDWWVHLPLKGALKGKDARRGAKLEKPRWRSAHSINKGLRTIRTLMNWFRRRSMLAQLSSDLIADSLLFVRTSKASPNFLTKGEVRRLLDACIRHDAEVFKMTRAEHSRNARRGDTPRYVQTLPFVVFMLLTGMRFAEGAELRFSAIDFDSDQILLEAERTKTMTSRRVDLRITPKLISLLSMMKLRAAGLPFVFGGNKPISRGTWDAARKRLVKDYGAPRFTWHDLRRTCGTFLACAPSVHGAASGYLTAKRLGHSVEVSERHYLGIVRDVPADAKTLEAAMELEDVLDDLLASGPLSATA